MLPKSASSLLVLALSLPGISHALGLGNIRVESSLNEPLSAQVELIGATPEELQAIKAAVASPELFERFEVERPPFLSSATIAVGADAAGRPVLNVRSAAAFTEPMVDLVIDVRSGSQHMVRDYPLLLDPAGIETTTFADAPLSSPEVSDLLEQLPPVKVPDVVLFPAIVLRSFAGSSVAIGRLGARAAGRRVEAPTFIAKPKPVVVRAPASHNIDQSALLSAVNKLNGQVQFLQQTLTDTSRQLASANARIGDMERSGPQQPWVAARPAGEPSASSSSGLLLKVLLGVLVVVAGALAYAWRRGVPARTAAPKPASTQPQTVELPVLQPAADVPASSSVEAGEGDELAAVPEPADSGITVEMAQIEEIDVNTVEQPGPVSIDEPDTVIIEELAPKAGDATGTVLDYNLADLDGRAHHVEMPGTLRDHAVLVERRKNVVDTLMAAIKRDPTRSDLRMKLLETLYTAGATNLRIFKEVVRDLARHPERLNSDEWAQVMAMGREIAPDDPLFAEQSADSNVA